MQKDAIVHSISSVMLDPTHTNHAIRINDITQVTVNGQDLGLGGYLDIGLIDTMEDLVVNFIGAVVFSVFGVREEPRQEGLHHQSFRATPQVRRPRLPATGD